MEFSGDTMAFALRSTIQALQPDLVAWRRDLHRYPELGFREYRTAEQIARRLQDWGIPHRTGIAHTGLVAEIAGTKPVAQPKVLALRADMDALPIQEDNPEITYSSLTAGLMHACGHDGHVAIALGTAQYLWQHRERFGGTVKILFQPAEEGPGGALPMIEAGVLKDPPVDGILGLHLWNNLPLGTVGVRSGPLMAAVETFECEILGKGGHGAIPQQTVDAVVVGAQVVTALQAIVARNVDPLQAAVITVGSFHAGTACNVIAGRAKLQGTVRYFEPHLADWLGRRIEETVAGVCAAMGARYRLDYRKLYPATVNDPTMAELVRSVALSVVETPLGVVPECQTMGGEDMAYFLQAVPGCYFFLGSAKEPRTYPHHHPRFDFDETALAAGVEIFVRCVERFCG